MAARVGDRFHAWVQRRFELPAALEEVEAEAAADPAELGPLIAAFEAGRFADRAPLGVEVPFVMSWGEQVLRGRIDAVYAWDRDGVDFLVVDWKTSARLADPLQLAVYRQAWAFYHVLADQLRLVDAPASLIDDALKAGVET